MQEQITALLRQFLDAADPTEAAMFGDPCIVLRQMDLDQLAKVISISPRVLNISGNDLLMQTFPVVGGMMEFVFGGRELVTFKNSVANYKERVRLAGLAPVA